MRFSAWSSLSISVFSGLALAAPAAAHLSIDPAKVVKGQAADLVFSVPNEDDAIGVDHVTLGIPQDFQLDDVEAKPGWTQSRTGQAVTWSGGLIPKGTFARFSIRGTAPAKAETVLFNVLVGDRTGKSITYRVGLDVTAASSQDKGARTLGKAALGVAILAAVLALGALFVGLYLWLRPPPL
ncbi:MAG: rane protein [Actinomycetia bacterium]|nr:rane protein [Actinomycetes bacterium]